MELKPPKRLDHRSVYGRMLRFLQTEPLAKAQSAWGMKVPRQLIDPIDELFARHPLRHYSAPAYFKPDYVRPQCVSVVSWKSFKATDFPKEVQQIVGLIGCKYPCGDTPHIKFCNKLRIPGSAYCAEHKKRCYVRVK